MALNRALVTLATKDANPANFATNSWYFDDNEDPGTNLPLIAAELATNYNDMRSHFGNTIATNGHQIEFYKLSDPKPRVPVYVHNWNFTGATHSGSMPQEVAMVLSFQADKVSGLPQARRRGRVYFGPLGGAAEASGRPGTTLLSAVVAFGAALLSESNLADWTWVVYSTVNNGGAPVTNGWVDNSFDTQRRRGLEWTARTTF